MKNDYFYKKTPIKLCRSCIILTAGVFLRGEKWSKFVCMGFGDPVSNSTSWLMPLKADKKYITHVFH